MIKDKPYGILFSKPSTPFFTQKYWHNNHYELKIMIRCVEI